MKRSPTWVPRVGDFVRVHGQLGRVTQVAPVGMDGVMCRVRRPTVTTCGDSSHQPATAYWLHEVEPAMNRTVRHEMEARGMPVSFNKSTPADPGAHFRQASQSGWDDLSTRTVGNAEDLSTAFMNAAHAMQHVRHASTAELAVGFRVNDDVDHAMLLTSLAAGTVSASLLLHLQEAPWFGRGASTLLRSALEALASAAALLVGGDGFLARWLRERERIDPKLALPFLFEVLRTRRAEISDPTAVYSWLSRSGHWDLGSIQTDGGGPSHAEVYCAIAYISWSCMVIAEVATGYEGLAEWPERWSDPLPWTASGCVTVGA